MLPVELSFNFDAELVDRIKAMAGACQSSSTPQFISVCGSRFYSDHPALRSGLLEALDRIPRPEPDRGKDALLEGIRRAHRRKRS